MRATHDRPDEATLAPLSRRQAEVLAFIQSFLQEQGFPPTIREIGRHMGIRSTNGVTDHLKALERKGLITRGASQSRSVLPVHHQREQHDIPVLGRIAAGQPLLAQENVEERIRLDSHLLDTTGEIFALRVQGDSMIEDGIFDGDLIFVRRQPTAERGAIVAALIDDEATVKRFYPERDRIRLQPANRAMAPIYIRSEEARETAILGVVVGVFRRV